ncbi:MAG: hypothetical protein ACI4EA_01930 [Candidatus Ornithomonoglobus sp.]
MVLKIVLLAICALLLVICYRTRMFAEKILRKKEEEITDALILKLKTVSLVISIVIFICTMIFLK